MPHCLTSTTPKSSDLNRRSLRRRLYLFFFGSLSARLLVLTTLFVLLSEILIYVPSIARFRESWIHDRLNAAIIASLAIEAAGERRLPDPLRAELLARAGVIAVSVKRDGRHELVLGMNRGVVPDAHYDVEHVTYASMILQAFETLFSGGDRIVRISGRPEMSPGEIVDIVVEERGLRSAMLAFSWRILGLSILISMITAGLVVLSLDRAFVRPMRRLTSNMLAFRDRPEDARGIIVPSARVDEVGMAEQALAQMQSELRGALRQKSRLAALGAAVSKINHDLRNILATAHLISDRFASSTDPLVQRELPKLVRAIDRAIDLTTDTLRYGKAEEPLPRRERFLLAPLVDELAASLPQSKTQVIQFRNDVVRALTVDADPDQVHRILLNLTRNAVQAFETAGRGGTIKVSAQINAKEALIDVTDDGPGIPDAVRSHLFEVFGASRGNGGTGLGLAIARELARGHGGDLDLVSTGVQGTTFRLRLPQNRG